MALRNSIRCLYVVGIVFLVTLRGLFGDDVEVVLDDAPPEMWTRERAKAWAYKHNVRLLSARADLQRQTGQMWSARSRLLPRVTMQGSYSSRDESLIDRSEREFTLPPDGRSAITQERYTLSAEVRQVIFDGFGSWSAFKSSLASLDEAMLNQRDSLHRLVNEVDSAFDQVLASQTALGNIEDSLSLQEQLFELTRKRLEAGQLVEYDVLRAEELLARGRVSVLEARERLGQAIQRFIELLQLPKGQDQGEFTVLFSNEELTLVAIELSEDEALKMALHNNARLLGAQKRYEKAKYDVKSAQSGIWPRVEAFSSYEVRNSFFNESRVLSGVTVGLSATWNIFDGFDRRGQLLARLADRNEADMSRRATRISVEQTIATSYDVLRAASERFAAADKLIELADRSYRETIKRYDLGNVDLQRVIDTQVSLQDAQVRWLNALIAHNNAVYQIRYLTALSEEVSGKARTVEDLSDEAGLDNQQWRDRFESRAR